MKIMSKIIKVKLDNSEYRIVIDHNILKSINLTHKKYYE